MQPWGYEKFVFAASSRFKMRECVYCEWLHLGKETSFRHSSNAVAVKIAGACKTANMQV